MRFINAVIFLLFSVYSLYAQDIKISGLVTDKQTNEIIPFANIMVQGYTIGTTSDKNGFFEIFIDDSLKNETIVISYVGYKTEKLAINQTIFDTIRLQAIDIKINEVVIKPTNKKSKPLVINPIKQKNCCARYSPTEINNNYWIPTRPKEPTIEALYFPYKTDYRKKRRIKEVCIQVTNYKPTASYFNLRLFKADVNSQPSEDLLTEPIIVKVISSSQLIRINLEEYNLIMPDKGIFIGFELLIINDNMSIVQVKKGIEHTLYNPYLNYTRCASEQKFWIYSKGKWVETLQKTPHLTKKNVMVYYKPAVSLILAE